MKKLLFLAFMAVGTLTVQAQTETASSATSISDDAAAKAASLDQSIDRRVCETSGKVSYYKKEVCEKSGKVSFEQVQYDATAGQFVNVAPSQVAEKAACGSKSSASGKSCCSSKGASAAAASTTEGSEKAACGSAAGASGKACCSSKKTKGSSAAVSAEENTLTPTAKKVKN